MKKVDQIVGCIAVFVSMVAIVVSGYSYQLSMKTKAIRRFSQSHQDTKPTYVLLTEPDKWVPIPMKDITSLLLMADKEIMYNFTGDDDLYGIVRPSFKDWWGELNLPEVTLYVKSGELPCTVMVIENSTFAGTGGM